MMIFRISFLSLFWGQEGKRQEFYDSDCIYLVFGDSPAEVCFFDLYGGGPTPPRQPPGGSKKWSPKCPRSVPEKFSTFWGGVSGSSGGGLWSRSRSKSGSSKAGRRQFWSIPKSTLTCASLTHVHAKQGGPGSKN